MPINLLYNSLQSAKQCVSTEARHSHPACIARRFGVRAGSKPVHIGYFDSQQGAARAYDQEAIRLRGPNTSLNFPITDYDVSMPHGSDSVSLKPQLKDTLLALMTSENVHRVHMCIACQATAQMVCFWLWHHILCLF